MDVYNQEIAGLSNLNQFVKEILDLENIKKFYEQQSTSMDCEKGNFYIKKEQRSFFSLI